VPHLVFLSQEFVAKCLSLPGESEIADLMDVADPDAIHTVRRFVIKEIATSLREDLLKTVCAVLNCLFKYLHLFIPGIDFNCFCLKTISSSNPSV
jgi:aminopeptidase N